MSVDITESTKLGVDGLEVGVPHVDGARKYTLLQLRLTQCYQARDGERLGDRIPQLRSDEQQHVLTTSPTGDRCPCSSYQRSMS